MSSPGVTAVITNWNGVHYLPGCLDALRAQTAPLHEIILVDNASDDDSVAWTREHHPDVRIVEMADNGGPCPARNAGIEAATTPLVLAVDNDANLAPDALEHLLPHLTDDVAIVQPRAVFDGERDRIHYDGADLHYVGIMTLHAFYAPVFDAAVSARDIGAAISMALLVHRARFLDAGGFDPAHFILFEDHDLSYRLRLRGWRIVHEPAALCFHREGTEGISFREPGTYAARRVFLHSRNRWIVVLKCHGWRAILLGAPGLLLYELAYFAFALRDRAPGAWFRGKRDLLGMLPALLARRREVQRGRKVPDRRLLTADPLTVSPLIRRGRVLRVAQGGLDVVLRVWWRLVGWMT